MKPSEYVRLILSDLTGKQRDKLQEIWEDGPLSHLSTEEFKSITKSRNQLRRFINLKRAHGLKLVA